MTVLSAPAGRGCGGQCCAFDALDLDRLSDDLGDALLEPQQVMGELVKAGRVVVRMDSVLSLQFADNAALLDEPGPEHIPQTLVVEPMAAYRFVIGI